MSALLKVIMKAKYIFSFLGILSVLGVSGQTFSALKSKVPKVIVSKIKYFQEKSKGFNHKRGAFTADLDSAAHYAELSLALSEKYLDADLENESLCLLGEACFKAKKRNEGITYFSKAIGNWHILDNKSAEGKTWLRMGVKLGYYQLGGPEILSSEWKASEIFLKIHDLFDLVDVYEAKGHHFRSQRVLDSAKIYLDSSIVIADNIKRKDRYKTYLWLCDYYRSTGDHRQALKFIQLALQNAKEQHTPETSLDYGDCYTAMGIFVYDGNRQQAYIYWRLAIDCLKKSNDEYAVYYLYYAYHMLAIYYINDKKPEVALRLISDAIKKYPPITALENGSIAQTLGECNSKLNKLDLAESQYLKAIAYYKGYPTQEAGVRANLMRFYSESKQFDKLKAGATSQGEAAMSRILSYSNKPYIEFQNYQIDSVKGDYQAALRHFQMWKMLSDSINNAVKIKQLNELQVKYETKEKEQSIDLLRNQTQQATLKYNIKEAELQKANLQQKIQQVKLQKMQLQRNVQTVQLRNSIFQRDLERADLGRSNLEKNVTFCGLGMLLLVLGVAFNGYRNKARSNSLLMTKQHEINQQNIQLERLVTDKDGLLKEKDWLLKEVHHRVKNNLQIVMSLLNSQVAYLDNEDAINAIGESQNRVQAIALIHQSLYKDNERSTVDILPYINSLIDNLKHSFDTNKRKISFIQAVEPFTTDIEQAVPLGLILNEAITNAIKYAFEIEGGTITVSIKISESNLVLMDVKDNGRGLDPQFEILNADSLGMVMMRGLSKQLGGTFQIINSNGTMLSVTYPLKKGIPFS